MIANPSSSWMGRRSNQKFKTTSLSRSQTTSPSACTSTSMEEKNADSILVPPRKSTSALSVSPRHTTHSLGNAAQPLPAQENQVVFDSPVPPPPPSRSSSSHPDILLKIATPYNADAFESFLDQYPDLKSRYPNLVLKLRNGFVMGEFPVLEETVIWPNSPTVEERVHR